MAASPAFWKNGIARSPHGTSAATVIRRSAHTAVVPLTAPPPSRPPAPRDTYSSVSMSLHTVMSANPGGARRRGAFDVAAMTRASLARRSASLRMRTPDACFVRASGRIARSNSGHSSQSRKPRRSTRTRHRLGAISSTPPSSNTTPITFSGRAIHRSSDSADRPSSRRTAAGSETGTRRVLTTSKRMKCAGGARALGTVRDCVDVSNVNVTLSSSPGPARARDGQPRRSDATRRVHVDFASVSGRRPEPEAAPPRAAHTTVRAPTPASTRAHGDIARCRAPSSAARRRARQVFYGRSEDKKCDATRARTSRSHEATRYADGQTGTHLKLRGKECVRLFDNSPRRSRAGPTPPRSRRCTP